MPGPSGTWLKEGRRLHLQHGPIDLIIGADGDPSEVKQAFGNAVRSFETVLPTLVDELSLLRAPIGADVPVPAGAVARRMTKAVAPFSGKFVTPMAAVAGAVADHVLEAMLRGRYLTRAFVNNGGDIALHLSGPAEFKVGICTDSETGASGGRITLGADDGIRGLATSGWRGRSLSMGIADAVTVLADQTAVADAAATIIANAVDLPGSDAIERVPAQLIDDDSDLGERLVTVAVAPLAQAERSKALSAGAALALDLVDNDMIKAAFLSLQGTSLIVGDSPGKICPTNTAERLSAMTDEQEWMDRKG